MFDLVPPRLMSYVIHFVMLSFWRLFFAMVFPLFSVLFIQVHEHCWARCIWGPFLPSLYYPFPTSSFLSYSHLYMARTVTWKPSQNLPPKPLLSIKHKYFQAKPLPQPSHLPSSPPPRLSYPLNPSSTTNHIICQSPRNKKPAVEICSPIPVPIEDESSSISENSIDTSSHGGAAPGSSSAKS